MNVIKNCSAWLICNKAVNSAWFILCVAGSGVSFVIRLVEMLSLIMYRMTMVHCLVVTILAILFILTAILNSTISLPFLYPWVAPVHTVGVLLNISALGMSTNKKLKIIQEA